ncbi:MAG: DMT family transporter [Dehalococcoidia bacterium]
MTARSGGGSGRGSKACARAGLGSARQRLGVSMIRNLGIEQQVGAFWIPGCYYGDPVGSFCRDLDPTGERSASGSGRRRRNVSHAMTAVVLALGASVAWGSSNFLAGLHARSAGYLVVLFFAQPLAVCAILVMIASRQEPLPPRVILPAVIAGAASAIGLAALYRGLSSGTMTVVAPIGAAGAAIPVIGRTFVGERLTGRELTGIGLVLVGVIALALRRGHSEPFSWSKGAGYGLLAAISGGCFLWGIGVASQANLYWGLGLHRIALMLCVAVAILFLRPTVALRLESILLIILIGLLDITGATLFALAATTGLLSIAAVLGSTYSISTVLLARMILHERVQQHQHIGLAFTLTGICLLSVR